MSSAGYQGLRQVAAASSKSEHDWSGTPRTRDDGLIPVDALAVDLEGATVGQERAATQALDTVISPQQVHLQCLTRRESSAAGTAAGGEGTRNLSHGGLLAAKPGRPGPAPHRCL